MGGLRMVLVSTDGYNNVEVVWLPHYLYITL